MANLQIDDQTRAILARATIEGTAVKLPAGQLPRPLYNLVDKALRNAGGKWNRAAQAHIFTTDPTPKLATMLNSGVAVDEKKRDQAFFTPPPIALQAATLADVSGKDVLEPSAGEAALATACLQLGASDVTCIEINIERVLRLRQLGFSTLAADFLKERPERWKPFDRIVMNPPFRQGQDIKHVNRALQWLAPAGILVSIMFGNQDRPAFAQLVKNRRPEIIELPRGSFRESGTDIPTVIIKIRN
jgi:hypothetical protein